MTGGSGTLVWGAAAWLPIAAAAAAVLLAALVWGYWRAGLGRWLKWVAGALKALAVLLLALCLLEPLFSGARARPGANAFVILVDNSQSMTLRDRDAPQTRAEQVKTLLAADARWLSRLRQDFDVRAYALDTQLRGIAGAEALSFDGRASNVGEALERVVQRYRGRPLAGILLVSDGVATDGAAVERLIAAAAAAAARAAGGNADVRLPPVYPVLVGGTSAADDVGVGELAVTQTNFEDAPVTITARASASGYAGRSVVAQLLDESGKPIEQQTLKPERDGKPAAVRFQVRPQQPGVSFYRLRVAAEGELAQFEPNASTREATLANNTRLVAVDRGRGPYRVLYVSGRPNWEFKFLQRALQGDDQVQLVGLIRIARREPKFNFLSRAGEDSNPLYRGFDAPDKQEVEQYDQPVIVRLGASDENELRKGFPQTAEELFGYHAVVLDDLEAEFFTQDQMQILKDFVRQRGGGLLMLGGQESFRNGRFDRTPIGDLLPVYADEVPPNPPGAKFKLSLTREGWLEPWVRLRPEEDAERKRLADMPGFLTLNRVRGIKPGATVLARVLADGAGEPVPALVEQRFGQGRVGALLIGDLWRWGLRRPADSPGDLEKGWRQTVRWLVSEVPKRVEIAVQPAGADGSDDDGPSDGGERDAPEGAAVLAIQVRDPAYAPQDNAAVTVRVTPPDGKAVELTAEPAAARSGRYEALYVPRQPGAYRAEVVAAAADGSEVGRAQAGWASDPAGQEFQSLQPNRELLERIAKSTGGEAVPPAAIERLVGSLPTRHVEITEPYVRPLWHTSWVFLLAILCLCAEWGLRRWKGLP